MLNIVCPMTDLAGTGYQACYNLTVTLAESYQGIFSQRMTFLTLFHRILHHFKSIYSSLQNLSVLGILLA